MTTVGVEVVNIVGMVEVLAAVSRLFETANGLILDCCSKKFSRLIYKLYSNLKTINLPGKVFLFFDLFSSFLFGTLYWDVDFCEMFK